jgi:GxxExxY protein
MEENDCSRLIIGAAIEVHRHLGPGLLESAYEMALAHELEINGLKCCRQVELPAFYKGVWLAESFRMDLIVEDSVIVEVKAVGKLIDVHCAQLLTYLRFAEKRLGLLLNFHVPAMRHGVRRIANDL